MTSGFFQITGHGISPTLQDTVIAAAKAFFSLPHEEKTKFAGSVGRGYEVIGAQALDPSTKPDLKEVSRVSKSRPLPTSTADEKSTTRDTLSAGKIPAGSSRIDNLSIPTFGLRQ
jgi:isopenicillin N synthase-like dioxygenase